MYNKLRAFIFCPNSGRYRPTAEYCKQTYVFRKSIGTSCKEQQLSAEWTGYVRLNFTSYKLRLSILTENQTTSYFVNHIFYCYKIEKALWGKK